MNVSDAMGITTATKKRTKSVINLTRYEVITLIREINIKEINKLDIKRAKEIVQKGFIWANWSIEQAEAFRELILETEKVEQLKKENDGLRNRLSELN